MTTTISDSAVNALAALALTRIAYKLQGETRSVAEFNLSGGAASALHDCLEAMHATRSMSPGTAFELGLSIASAVIVGGLDADLVEKRVAEIMNAAELCTKKAA